MIVDSLGAGVFLRDYWQRRPVLLRQALPDFVDPVSPEELAGLACDADIDARLIFTRGKSWQLKNGPFKTRDFTSLPKRNWTLLVQAVDQWVPAVKDLLSTVLDSHIRRPSRAETVGVRQQKASQGVLDNLPPSRTS